ncbi:MAG: flippase-like domain-containing protein [Bacteroidaceae bacterium]|nr:flippase-like domain-containing protein [Bacteroidaceae bacterium]
MYRGFQWDELTQALTTDVRWGWMLLSFPFGISAQVFRALRWRQLLTPMGERVRHHTSICAIFISYASSLVVPRMGEVLRCGVLKRWDGVRFSRGIGTVVTERVVDMALVLTFSALTVMTQIPIFLTFVGQTGLSLHGVLSRFTAAGYVVTALSLLLMTATCILLVYRLHVFSRLRNALRGLTDGILSIRDVRSPLLFLFYSVAIWVSYYLHFYVALFCFPCTEHLGPVVALVAFVVGCFAVLVPTPNGAGPWHFAVKTIFVMYGVGGTEGALCALVIHTVQTLLVALLGIYAVVAMGLTRKRVES